MNDVILSRYEIILALEVFPDLVNSIERRWLIELRGDKTQHSIAQAAGISQNFYSWIEKGKRTPSPQVAQAIASVLGFDWTRFYENPEKEEKETA